MKSKDIAKERNQKGVDWLLIRNAHNTPILKAIAAAVLKTQKADAVSSCAD